MSASIYRPGNRIRKWLIAGFFFISVVGSNAQDNRLTLRFDSIAFRDLVDTLEERVPYKFYYADEWSDSLYLNVNSTDATLEEFLNRTLRPAGFSFFITADNKVILSKGSSVKTSFREEFMGYIERTLKKGEDQDYNPPAVKEKESVISDEYRIFRIGQPAAGKNSASAVLSGRVTGTEDGRGVGGVIVYIEKLKMGAMTNDAGYYSVNLPKGQYQVEFRMIGMQTARRNIILYSGGTLNIDMHESTSEVEAVVITGNRSNIVRDVRTGIEKINIKMLKQIPMGLGEADVLKSSLLLPGVQTVGEASAGFNVRGGSTDQNLVFLNNAPIINTSHFFGFFSAFNSDLVSDVTLYKSGMPAKFGGRLSSVMDISPAEGNKEKINVSGGISPVTGRMMVEGPLDIINGTFIVGGRATYSDWILGLLKDYRLRNSQAGFYDLQGMIRSEVDEKNSVSLSGYFSNDKFDYYREQAFNYGNLASTLKWEHSFNQKLSAQFYAILSNYRYRTDMNQDSAYYSSMSYVFNQKILRADFLYYTTSRHKLEFGIDATYHSLRPGVRKPVGEYSLVIPKELEKEHAAEPSLYFSDEFEVSPLLMVSGGLRATLFTAFGPRTEFRYSEGVTRSAGSINDTVSYHSGEVLKMYPGLEYRLSSRMIVTPDFSIKLGMQRVYQYIHMISNTTSMSPTDIWKLSDRYIRPQRSDQLSLGLYGNFGRKAIETSAEAYYKKLKNILDYKGGATLLMNEHLETDVISGNGKAYGVELMVKKQYGSFTGWISYTYSRILLQIDGQYGVEKVNGGEYFPADFDKPHDLKIVSNTKLSRRFNLTTNFAYNTGRPITYPVAFYGFNNANRVYYSNRNEYRIPDYIRLDLAATVNGNLKAKKLNHSSFTFTVYNVLGRKNPYSIFFRTEEGEIKGYQMSIFSRPIFMASYSFRIRGNATGDF
jgi:hypothetical protein